MPKVNTLTNLEKQAIIDKSPLTLPNNPTQSGYSSAQIKQKMAGMVTDTEDSVLAILDEKLEEIDDAFTDTDGDVTAINGRLTTVEGKVSTLEGQNLNTRVTTAETDIDALEGRMTTAEGDIDSLEGRMTTAESDINQAENNIITLNDIKANKATTIIGIDLQNNITLEEFKTALGNATTSLAGLMSAEDKTNLNNLMAVLGVADGDNIVNTITEILAVFENYPEGFDLVNAFAGKVDKVAGKELSANDLTNTLKTNYDTAYNHSQITNGTNPHQTTFANIQTKPTTLGGYGITDAYTQTQIDTSLSSKADIVDGKIPAGQLPSYVDDVLEVYERAGATPAASDWFSLTSGGAAITPEAGKIYVIIAGALINKTYRWSGTQYSIIGEMALGTTAATAFFGDRGLSTETQSNNIVSGVQGLTDTRITNSAVGVSPLIVNSVASTTASLQEWKVNNTAQAYIEADGGIRTPIIRNLATSNNSSITIGNNGVQISRNVADANPSLIVNLANISSTGNIANFQFAGVNKLEVTKDGFLNQNGTRLLSNAGTSNIFVGNTSGNTTLTGQWNVGVGASTLNLLTTQQQNTAVGQTAGRDITGSQNTVIGAFSGTSISGTANTFLGRLSGNNASQLVSASNSTAIGNEAFTDKSNQMVFGNASVSEFVFDRNTSAVLLAPEIEILGAVGNKTLIDFKIPVVGGANNGGRIILRRDGNAEILSSINMLAENLSTGTHNYISFNTNNDLTNTERMRITSTGNVGIGTASPNLTSAGRTTVDVNGTNSSIYALSVGGTASGFMFHTGTDLLISNERNGVLGLNVNGDRRMTILATGNVGIGTSNPANLLELKKDTPAFRQTSVSESGGYVTTFGLGYDGNDTFVVDVNPSGAAATRILKYGAGANGNLTLNYNTVNTNRSFIITDGATERMRVNANGLVGIGTNNPSEKLHVVGNARIEGNLTVNGSVTQVNTDVANTERLTITNDGTGPAIIANQTGAQPVVDFQDDGVSAFYIADGGKVGIGTTSPSTILDVKGELSIRSATSAKRMFLSFNEGLDASTIGSIQDGVAFKNTHINRDGGNVFFAANSAGNVGIGTTNPFGKLDVFGNAVIRNTDNTSVSFTVAIGTAYNTDRRTRVILGALNDNSVNNDVAFQHFLDVVGTATGKSLTFNRLNRGGTEVESMRIANNGNVGIGTNNPSYSLHIAKASGDTYTAISSAGGATLLGTVAGGNTVLLNDTNDKPITIWTTTGGSFTEKMRVTGTGLVGINETSPGGQLTIKSGATDRAPLIVNTLAGQTAVLQVWQVNGTGVAEITNTGGAYFGGSIISETTTKVGVHLGTITQPRILFSNGTSAQNFQIDNLGGDMRFFVPGSLKMTLKNSGNLEIEGLAQFAGTPSNAQTGDYTLVLADKGKVLRINSATNRTVTIPLNSSVAFPIDTEIAILRYGTGTVSISPTSGVTLNSVSSNRKVKDRYGSVALKKIGTDEWVLVGSLEA